MLLYNFLYALPKSEHISSAHLYCEDSPESCFKERAEEGKRHLRAAGNAFSVDMKENQSRVSGKGGEFGCLGKGNRCPVNS